MPNVQNYVKERAADKHFPQQASSDGDVLQSCSSKRSFKGGKFTFFSQMVQYDMVEQAVVAQQEKHRCNP